MKQTAVEYIVDQLLPKALTAEQYYHIERAKQMEKEQCLKMLPYDLDELAEKACPDVISSAHSAYKAGFQKALELMGDKKFSINEVVELTKILISNPFETCGKTYQELTDSYIQSLQQTEWEVEVEKENVMHDYNGTISLGAKFKLDADGCLILKLKSE